MKRKITCLIALIAIFSLPASVRAQEALPVEPDNGAVVCEPGVYLLEPDDCAPLGPSVYLTELARYGLTIPPRLLPSFKPDPSLTQLPYSYFHLDKDYVPIYDAPGKSGPADNNSCRALFTSLM